MAQTNARFEQAFAMPEWANLFPGWGQNAMSASPGVDGFRRSGFAVYAETADFFRRAVDRQMQALERCLQAETFEAAFDIHVETLRQAVEDYTEHMTRVSQLLTRP